MKKTILLAALGGLLVAVPFACGENELMNTYMPPGDGGFNPGYGGTPGAGTGTGTGTGVVAATTTTGSGTGGVPAPSCPDTLKLCPETFTYPYNGETSVELRGDYRAGAWTMGDLMTHTGNVWTVTVNVPWDVPGRSTSSSSTARRGSRTPAIPRPPTTPATPRATASMRPSPAPATSPAPRPRCRRRASSTGATRSSTSSSSTASSTATPANNCNVPGTSRRNSTTSANYLGGDWAGVTQKINARLLHRPRRQHALDHRAPQERRRRGRRGHQRRHPRVLGLPRLLAEGPDHHRDLLRHRRPISRRWCTAAHAKNLKVLFDYAMVHVHTESTSTRSTRTTARPGSRPTASAAASNCAAALRHQLLVRAVPRALRLHEPGGARRSRSTRPSRSSSRTATTPSASTPSSRSTRAGSPRCARPITSQIHRRPRRRSSASTWSARRTTSRTAALIAQPHQPDDAARRPVRLPAAHPPRRGDADAQHAEHAHARRPQLERNAPPGMTGLAAVHGLERRLLPDRRGDEHVHRQPRPAALDPLRRADPARLAQSDSPSNPSAADGKSNAWSGEPALETEPNTYERLANAFAVILTNKGAPLIYYGDEIGLPGAGDPDNRRMMQWSGYSAAQQGLHDRITGAHRDPRGPPGDAARRRAPRST